MQKDNLRLLVAIAGDNCAAPLPVLEMRAHSAQAAFLQTVFRLLVCEITNQLQKSWLSWFAETPFVTNFANVCNNQSHVIGTHVSVL